LKKVDQIFVGETCRRKVADKDFSSLHF
jgi:hypothetical protein